MSKLNTQQPGKSEERERAGHDGEQIIRVVGSDGLFYDVRMTQEQVQEARRLARESGQGRRKQSFHDMVVALLNAGVLTVVPRTSEIKANKGEKHCL